jgi:hypothetical protein
MVSIPVLPDDFMLPLVLTIPDSTGFSWNHSMCSIKLWDQISRGTPAGNGWPEPFDLPDFGDDCPSCGQPGCKWWDKP